MFRKFAKGGYTVPEGGFQPKFAAPVGVNLRPCKVNGEPALFHRWADEDKGLLRINVFTRPEEQESLHRRFRDAGVVPHGCSTEVLRATFALVEYPDGTVKKVRPDAVRFMDRWEG